jgi:low affinity Fe/Cu permease
MIDRILSHKLTRILACMWCILMPIASMDAANYGISVATFLVFLLMFEADIRDRKAVHVKLDDLECAIDNANSENARLEEKTLDEIEQARV